MLCNTQDDVTIRCHAYAHIAHMHGMRYMHDAFIPDVAGRGGVLGLRCYIKALTAGRTLLLPLSNCWCSAITFFGVLQQAHTSWENRSWCEQISEHTGCTSTPTMGYSIWCPYPPHRWPASDKSFTGCLAPWTSEYCCKYPLDNWESPPGQE